MRVYYLRLGFPDRPYTSVMDDATALIRLQVIGAFYTRVSGGRVTWEPEVHRYTCAQYAADYGGSAALPAHEALAAIGADLSGAVVVAVDAANNTFPAQTGGWGYYPCVISVAGNLDCIAHEFGHQAGLKCHTGWLIPGIPSDGYSYQYRTGVPPTPDRIPEDWRSLFGFNRYVDNEVMGLVIHDLTKLNFSAWHLARLGWRGEDVFEDASQGGEWVLPPATQTFTGPLALTYPVPGGHYIVDYRREYGCVWISYVADEDDSVDEWGRDIVQRWGQDEWIAGLVRLGQTFYDPWRKVAFTCRSIDQRGAVVRVMLGEIQPPPPPPPPPPVPLTAAILSPKEIVKASRTVPLAVSVSGAIGPVTHQWRVSAGTLLGAGDAWIPPARGTTSAVSVTVRDGLDRTVKVEVQIRTK